MTAVGGLLGRLVGTLLNPIIWLVAIGVIALTKGRNALLRLALVAAATLVFAVVFYSLDRQMTWADKVRGAEWSIGAAVLIGAVALLFPRLR